MVERFLVRFLWDNCPVEYLSCTLNTDDVFASKSMSEMVLFENRDQAQEECKRFIARANEFKTEYVYAILEIVPVYVSK